MVEKSKKAIQDFILMIITMEIISLVITINFPKWYIPFGKYVLPVCTVIGILVSNNYIPCFSQLLKKQKVINFNFPLFVILMIINLYSYRNIVMYSLMINYKEVIVSLVISIICLKLYNSYADTHITIFDVVVLVFVKKGEKKKTKEKKVKNKPKKKFNFFNKKKEVKPVAPETANISQ